MLNINIIIIHFIYDFVVAREAAYYQKTHLTKIILYCLINCLEISKLDPNYKVSAQRLNSPTAFYVLFFCFLMIFQFKGLCLYPLGLISSKKLLSKNLFIVLNS